MIPYRLRLYKIAYKSLFTHPVEDSPSLIPSVLPPSGVGGGGEWEKSRELSRTRTLFLDSILCVIQYRTGRGRDGEDDTINP